MLHSHSGMIRPILQSLTLAALSLSTACLGPPCPAPIKNPSATVTLTPDASVFVVQWSPLPELSNAYYSALRVLPTTEPGLSRGTDAGVLRLTAAPPAEARVELQPSALRAFTLAFGDPRSELRCTHAGMDDVFLIDIDARDGGVNVSQSVELGAL